MDIKSRRRHRLQLSKLEGKGRGQSQRKYDRRHNTDAWELEENAEILLSTLQ